MERVSGRGTYFFHLRIRNYPLPCAAYSCILHRTLFIGYEISLCRTSRAQWHDKGPDFKSEPLLCPFHCVDFKSKQWGEGKCCSGLARHFPRCVPCVFRAMWLFAERGNILACGKKKESTCVCGYSLFVLYAVGYSARLLTLSLTSAVNSSKACMMSSSRLVVIPLFKRSRKASRSAVESVRD